MNANSSTFPTTHFSWAVNTSIWIGVIACWGSLAPWPMWPSEYLSFLLLMVFVATRVVLWRGQSSWATTVAMISTVAFAFIYAQLFINPILAAIFQTIATILPILAFLTFKDIEREVFLKRLINFFSLIALVSIIGFALHFFIDLPYIISNHYNSFYAPYKNFLVFVINQDADFGWFTRFSSIYAEPGHMSMMCAILLFINGYTWRKWQNIVMTLSLIWTLSLAGFILYVGGVILYALCISKRIGVTVLKITGTTLLLILLGISYYSPTNTDVISVRILSRLEFDESKGLSGNNRNSIKFDQFYEDFQSGPDKWLGIGRYRTGEIFGGTGNASYKNYVLANGIVSSLAVLFLAATYLFCYPSRRGLGLMILLAVSFIQRPYFLWAIECMPYLAALTTYRLQLNSKFRLGR